MTQALLSPGQSYNEQDLSYYVPALSTTHVGLIGTATKGPLNEPTLCTSVQDFENKFGPAHPDHLATYSARLYFTQGRLLTFVRVADENTTNTGYAKASSLILDAAATRAVSTGTKSGPFLISATNKIFSLYHGTTPATRSITLTTGLRTAQQIVDEINDGSDNADADIKAAFADIVAVVGPDQTIRILSSDTGASATFVIDGPDVTNSANVVLGIGEQSSTSDPPVATEDHTTATGADEAANGGITVEALTPGSWGDDLSVRAITGSNDQTFKLEVKFKTVIVESYDNLSVEESNSRYFADVVNVGGSSPSNYIKLTAQSSNTKLSISADNDAGTPDFEDLDGGADGTMNLSDDDYGAVTEGTGKGLDLFRDKESITVNMLAVPGEANVGVVSNLISLAEDRGDILAVIDPPYGLDRQEVIDYHNGQAVTGDDPQGGSTTDYDGEQLNSSHAAMYWPWVQIYDPRRNENVWTPPSAHAILAMVRTDFAEGEHFAPAGPVRGLLPHAIAIETNPNQGDRDLLYDTQGAGNAINPIIRSSSYGVAIWGQRTLQRTPSALDRINVRRLMIRIRQLVDIAAAGLIFGQADITTAITFARTINPALDALVQRRALRDYRLIADGSNNIPETLARNEVHASIFVSPIRTAEFFHLNTVITEQGATFEELAL